MTDINGLRIINNAYGHQQGDEVLKQTPNILKSCLRKDDTLARWAGKEIPLLARIISIVDAYDVMTNGADLIKSL